MENVENANDESLREDDAIEYQHIHKKFRKREFEFLKKYQKFNDTVVENNDSEEQENVNGWIVRLPLIEHTIIFDTLRKVNEECRQTLSMTTTVDLKSIEDDCSNCNTLSKENEEIKQLLYKSGAVEVCDLCPFMAVSGEVMKEHMHKIHDIINENYNDERRMKYLRKLCKYVCPFCDKRSKVRNLRISKDCSRCNKQCLLLCIKCGTKLETCNEMEHHLLNICVCEIPDKKRRAFYCDHCTFRTKHEDEFEKHKLSHSTDSSHDTSMASEY